MKVIGLNSPALAGLFHVKANQGFLVGLMLFGPPLKTASGQGHTLLHIVDEKKAEVIFHDYGHCIAECGKACNG